VRCQVRFAHPNDETGLAVAPKFTNGHHVDSLMPWLAAQQPQNAPASRKYLIEFTGD
jgi:hypothetical protein